MIGPFLPPVMCLHMSVYNVCEVFWKSNTE